MKMLVCTACGSNELISKGNRYVCPYCGSQFVKNTPGVSSVNRSSEIEEMLRRADMFWRHNNKLRAKQIYRQILELDSTCDIARQRV